MEQQELEDLATTAYRMGYTTTERLTERMVKMIIRNQAYLERRRRRGTHTPTDDTIAEDMAVAALTVKLLRKLEGM